MSQNQNVLGGKCNCGGSVCGPKPPKKTKRDDKPTKKGKGS